MFELRMAFRNILRQRRRSLLTGLALMVCFVLFSFQESVTDGTYGSMIDLFTRDHTGHVQLHREGYLERPSINKIIASPQAAEETLRSMDGVVAFTSRVKGAGLGYGNNKTTPVQIIGLEPEGEAQTTTIKQRIEKGAYLRNEAAPDGVYGVMIGLGVAENLKLGLGDELILISQGADGSVANERFRVEAVVGTMESYDQPNVYLPLKAAQEFFSLGQGVHEFAILLDHFSRSEAFARRLGAELGKTSGQGAALQAEPWQVVEEDFYRAMQTDKSGNVIAQFIILLIVAIGVLNAVLMTILERTREYGVLKAMGTRPARLFRLIVLEVGLLAALSVVAGLLFALPLNYWFATQGIEMSTPIDIGGVPYSRMLGEMSLKSILKPAGVIIVAAIVIALFPAVAAIRTRVVDALRST